MADADLVAFLNNRIADGRALDTCVTTLRGQIRDFDRQARECRMAFVGDSKTMSNSRGLQGGYAAAMCDTACAYLAMLMSSMENTMSTLEQKCSYIAPVPLDEPVVVHARIVRQGKSVIFFEATLKDRNNAVCVIASQTSILIPAKRRTKQDSSKPESSSEQSSNKL